MLFRRRKSSVRREGRRALVTFAKLHTRAAVISLLVGGLLVAGTISVALTLAADEELHRRAEYRHIEEAYAASVGAHLQARFAVTDYLTREFMESRPGSQSAFEDLTEPVHDIFTGFQAINWIDENRIIRWITPVAGNEPARGLDISKIPASVVALDKSLAEKRLIVTPPIQLAQGGRGVVGYLGLVDDSGKFIGALNLVFRIAPLLEGAISDVDDDLHSLKLFDGNEVIYESEKFDANRVMWETNVPLPGREWTMQVSRQLPIGSVLIAKSHYIVLILGTLTSLSLAFLVFSQIARQDKIAAEERRFRDFASLNSDWFWETDANLRFSYFSERFEEVTGVSSTDLLGHTRREVGAPGADPEAYAAMLACMDSRRPFFGFEHFREHPGRGRVRISISGVPVYQDGEFVGYRGVGRDVTKEQHHAAQLERALVLAEQANQAKSEFLATMSHELRTPLNAILGFSEMIVQEIYGKIGNDNYKDYASHIASSGKHLLTLINDVLDISAIEAGKRRIDLEDVDVLGILNDCLTYIQHDADKKSIEVVSKTSGTPRSIIADHTGVKQIILNVLSNAVKYNQDGGKISVETRFSPDAFTLIVQDTGVGIPKASLTGVTEPFFRLQANPHLAQEGTGLGLAIVKSLVEQHGGRLEIDSEEGAGTTVTITLPQPPDVGPPRNQEFPGLT